MKQILVKQGKIIVEEVPAPMVNKNSVLVEVQFSLISTGTEMAVLTTSGESLLKKVVKKPNNIKKVINKVRTQSISQTLAKIKGQIETARPSGYSCSGVVIDVGENIKDIKIGDRVACAGGGYANHAEIVCVPRNLVVKIPENLGFKEAASVTLGAIAMQGVRRADSRIGEFVAVIGLGLIGQITVHILKAVCCRVVGVDIEKTRVELAKSICMDYGITSNEEDPVSAVFRFTNGYGVDSAIITAATQSDLPVKQAMEMTRKKGKIVVVGDVGLHLERKPFYERELDFLISTSYGPGRYDANYEEKGLDYPYAYVRWTENRNMQEYLRLLSENKININALVSQAYPIEEATKAYDALKRESRPLGVFLKYREQIKNDQLLLKLAREMVLTPKIKAKDTKQKILNVALIGAGNFAKKMRLPNLQKLNDKYQIYAIVDANSTNAKETAKKFGANHAATDYSNIIKDDNVDLVMVCTRHHLHAKMVIEALKAGKHVFVEKPLCLNKEELKEIIKTYNSINIKSLFLTVGFNRRYSPYAKRIKDIIKERINPMIINYRMNAGFIPKNHWIQTEQGGGRNIGEACHIYDLFNFFTESEVESISASSITPRTEQYTMNDNFVGTIKYKDGSVCNLTYTVLGTKEIPKEQMEIYVDEKIILLNDYKKLEIFGAKIKGMETKMQKKGHYEELIELAARIKEGNESPIPLWQLVQATEISFKVEEQLK